MQHRTSIIFTDFPTHIEFRVDGWPILRVGDEIELDLELYNLRDRNKKQRVCGVYKVSLLKFKYLTTDGFIQFLELSPVLDKK